VITLSKEILGSISVAIGVIGYAPYLYGLYKQKLKPHVFTWFIWGILMIIAFAAQWTSGGGAGTWITGFSALMCLVIAGIAFFNGEKNITRSDWITFVLGLATVPLWAITNTPLWSMILIILIGCMANWPTARKSWMKPQEESPLSYVFTVLKFVTSAMAMQDFNWITLSYPLALAAMNVGLVVLIMGRRMALEGRFNWD